MLQKMVMGNDVFVGTVFQAEPSRDNSKLSESQLFVKGQSGCIGADNSIELKNTESQLFCHGKTVAHKGLSRMLSTGIPPYGVAGVADMSAAPYIIGMKDIKSHRFS